MSPKHTSDEPVDASRRRFFRLLAGSPLLAAFLPGLPAEWQRAIAREVEHGPASALHTRGTVCPECGQELVYAAPGAPPEYAAQDAGQEPGFLDFHFQGQLIDSPDQAINVWDFERVAHANNLPEHWGYLHMGVDDFETRRANREGFQRLMLLPRRLGQDTSKLDIGAQLFGRRWNAPLALCPVAALEAYHTQGESGAARAAGKHGILQVQSHVSSQSYETIAKARGEPHWFQIYTVPDWDVNVRVIQRVEKAGCPVLVWTVDLLGGSNRELSRRSEIAEGGPTERVACQSCHNHKPGYERPMRAGTAGPPGPRHPYTWEYVRRLKDVTGMRVVLKGIVTREDAELAVEYGADAVFVSNHGGRAENSFRSTIEALPDVVAGVRGRVPVLIDSGVRRGSDIFKALALGADMVGVGRPYVWGLGAFGEEGVDRVIELLLAEFQMVMRQTRTTSLAQITSDSIIAGREPIMMRSNNLGFGL